MTNEQREAAKLRLIEVLREHASLSLSTDRFSDDMLLQALLDAVDCDAELVRLNPFARTDIDNKPPPDALGRFAWGVRYYLGMLEDGDNWSHSLGHIQELCSEFDEATKARAAGFDTTDPTQRVDVGEGMAAAFGWKMPERQPDDGALVVSRAREAPGYLLFTHGGGSLQLSEYNAARLFGMVSLFLEIPLSHELGAAIKLTQSADDELNADFAFPEPKTLGEKVAQHLVAKAMGLEPQGDDR